jgi:hypothetical protein
MFPVSGPYRSKDRSMLTISEDISATSFLRASYVDFADDTSIPRTNAAMVEIRAVESLTVSFTSVQRCSSGRTRRIAIPTNAAAKTQAKTMPLSGIEFIVFLFFQTNPAVCWLESDVEAARV